MSKTEFKNLWEIRPSERKRIILKELEDAGLSPKENQLLPGEAEQKFAVYEIASLTLSRFSNFWSVPRTRTRSALNQKNASLSQECFTDKSYLASTMEELKTIVGLLKEKGLL